MLELIQNWKGTVNNEEEVYIYIHLIVLSVCRQFYMIKCILYFCKWLFYTFYNGVPFFCIEMQKRQKEKVKMAWGKEEETWLHRRDYNGLQSYSCYEAKELLVRWMNTQTLISTTKSKILLERGFLKRYGQGAAI